MNVIHLAELGVVPDALIRIGIRRLLNQRRRNISAATDDQISKQKAEFAAQLRSSPLAVATEAANQQHYEVPSEFFELALGPRLKYSCCLFTDAKISLAEAEEEMLRQTCERAEIRNGNHILELGCGWGSLTLWMAEKYHACQITAVSNSASQREFIERRAVAKGLQNVRVITADMREFECDERFDRVVCVEMLEHMRNYELLLHRVSNWLNPEGKAFVHIFCHRESPYLFETEGSTNWMGRYFFTGGMMPSEDLFRHFGADLAVEQQWRVSGLHYWRTCEAWLRNVDRNRDAILHRFRQDLSVKESKLSLQRWRIFLLACAELFRYGGGDEWFVGHYRFTRSHVTDGAAEPYSARPSSTPVA